MLTVHPFNAYPNAAAIVSEWWSDRKDGDFPEAMIPKKTSVIVESNGEPVAFLAMYLYVDIGVCSLEWPVTKPGLGLKAREPMLFAIQALCNMAKALNYTHVRVATLPKIARFLEREGWIPEDNEVRIPLILQI